VFLDMNAVKDGFLVAAANVPLEEAMAHSVSARVVMEHFEMLLEHSKQFPAPRKVAQTLDALKHALGAGVLGKHAQQLAEQDKLAHIRAMLVERGELGGKAPDVVATNLLAAVRKTAMRVRRAFWCGKVFV